MAQRRPQRPIPIPMPPPVEHDIVCRCAECLTLDAVRYVENKPRRTRVVGADWNPHDGAWRSRLQW